MGALVVAAIFAIIVGWTGSIRDFRDQPKSEMRIAVPGPGPGYIRTYVNPLSESNKKHYIKQSHDLSCGSAALAILLNFYLGEKITEEQVITGLVQYGDLEQIKKKHAFSLLDMKRFLNVLGYQAEGYNKADLEDLRTLGKPCIVRIKIFDYLHFVVFRGIYKGRVFVTDPWRGDTNYTIDEFNDIWFERIMFTVSKDAGKTLRLLSLKEDDLRFIDEDAARNIILDHSNPTAVAAAEREFRRIVNNPYPGLFKTGNFQYFRQ